MNDRLRTPWLLPAILSAVFALLLFPAIVDTHGVARSVLYVALGMGCIWCLFLLLSSVFRRFYAEGRRDGERDDSDFV